MGGIQLALLLFLLGWERGLSLLCYTCTDIETAGLCQPTQCPLAGICYNSKMTVTFSNGKEVNAQYKGCAPTCKAARDIMGHFSEIPGPEGQSQGSLVKFDVQGVTCCEGDLCNGGALPGRSPWALVGGLLLSLGPACLWALL
ncbi:lymphocyte antigen 6H-like [Suricata suricatta]|uniref:lymphocyte antigen 6H-like n=1 Tax=Suricata suricatta TaxID=37032 RepID=UPI0011556D5B|nr:lymphocyte antigen 6H-like [Suricata suricatta]